MKAKLIINNQEIEVEISEEEYKKLQPKEKQTGYERVLNKTYYWTTGDGRLLSQVDKSSADALSYEVANYYSDRTVAENNARADKLMRQLRRFSVEHREKEIDWKDFCFSIGYSDKIGTYAEKTVKRAGCIYFDSVQTAGLAIDTFHDELIWYFTEYKASL